MAMRPIQTLYRGYFFRSRLEARWAVFFDSLKIKWVYEPEGYHLSNGEMYLPDFFLPKFGCPDGMYVEVKPDHVVVDRKAVQLADDSGVPVMMACGVPGPSAYRVLVAGGKEETICFVSDYLPGGSHESEYRPFVSPGYEDPDTFEIETQHIDHAVLAAIVSARSARFEHEQRGAVAV
jgi:hypothetical protein